MIIAFLTLNLILALYYFFSSTQELAPSGQYRLAWLLRPASLCPRLPLQHPAALQQLLSSPVCTAFSDEPIFIFFPPGCSITPFVQ